LRYQIQERGQPHYLHAHGPPRTATNSTPTQAEQFTALREQPITQRRYTDD
jgi:hypothetical protein